MSRDRRQRANQRRSRRTPDGGSAHPGELVRSNLPGALGRSSGEVDEFDAAIVKGAAGVPAPLPDESGGQSQASRRGEPVEDWLDDAQAADDADDDDGGDVAAGGAGSGSGGGGREVARDDPFGSDHPAKRHPRKPLPSRAVAFVRASWAELNRVQWPDRPQVFQATAVVLGFVAIAGVYLGVADWVAEHVIKVIL